MGLYSPTPQRKRYLLVLTDCFTKWIEAFSIPDSSAKTIISVLNSEVFSRRGFASEIITDNGKQFTGKDWESACEQWDIQHWTTPIYHLRANPVERRNQEIKKGLRLHLQDTEHRNWDLLLPTILYQLRKRVNAATGVSPGYAMIGQDLPAPGDWCYAHNDIKAIPSKEDRIESIKLTILKSICFFVGKVALKRAFLFKRG
ncbi:hypothetical protein TKK_0013298 [Trichogramma kaykai]